MLLSFLLILYIGIPGAIEHGEEITQQPLGRIPGEYRAGDEALATAILDRLLHHSQVIDMRGRSYWLTDIEQATTFSN